MVDMEAFEGIFLILTQKMIIFVVRKTAQAAA